MSIDKHFHHIYDAKNYNCAHFVCDVWKDLKGSDMQNVLRAFLCGPRDRRAVLSDLRRIRFISKPEDPCIVLMKSPKKQPHVGVWIRGRVLHLQEGGVGVQFQPLDVSSFGFKSVRFFIC